MKVATLVNSKTENDLIVKLVGMGEQTIYKIADMDFISTQKEPNINKLEIGIVSF